jgi:hypothetical protein
VYSFLTGNGYCAQASSAAMALESQPQRYVRVEGKTTILIQNHAVKNCIRATLTPCFANRL